MSKESDWRNIYKRGPYVTAATPSTIVNIFADTIPAESRAADLGCGDGRNAIFLANRGHAVDAYDIEDRYSGDEGWRQKLSKSASSWVHFERRDVEGLALPAETYGAIVATRLVQYMALASVERLIATSKVALRGAGLLFLSYTTEGGIRDVAGLDVKTFDHPVENITDVLTANDLEVIYRREADVSSRQARVNVEYARAHACDLVARRQL
ncbi:MAG TPA: class I SAM-dependent methyltransferase [Candidatus Saccharimonadales bacterium]|nr:class I SAM-dependent methyltransferase [Candidatus Saccharimonadales bacterium]